MSGIDPDTVRKAMDDNETYEQVYQGLEDLSNEERDVVRRAWEGECSLLAVFDPERDRERYAFIVATDNATWYLAINENMAVDLLHNSEAIEFLLNRALRHVLCGGIVTLEGTRSLYGLTTNRQSAP